MFRVVFSCVWVVSRIAKICALCRKDVQDQTEEEKDRWGGTIRYTSNTGTQFSDIAKPTQHIGRTTVASA